MRRLHTKYSLKRLCENEYVNNNYVNCVIYLECFNKYNE